MKTLVGKKALAYHEAGHAVIARMLGISIEYATLRALDGDARALAHSAAHLAPDDLEALEKDAIVALAGPTAQQDYRPLSRAAQKRLWKDGGWHGDSMNAMNSLGTLLMRQHDEPVVPGETALKGERAEELRQLLNRTHQKAADLVKESWPAIERVAGALLTHPMLTEAEIDALIAQPQDRE
jgi:ATP-dependent Zn protease